MPTLDQIIVWLVIGTLAGAAAGSLVRRQLSWGQMIITGLLGAIVGGFVLNELNLNVPDLELTFSTKDLIAALIGAAVLIVFAELFFGIKRARGR